MKYIFLLLMLISGHFAMAQDVTVDERIKEIDSLIEYNQFDEAEKKADNLYKLLNSERSDKKYAEQRAKVRLQQGIIIDNQFDHSQALPVLLDALDIAEKNNLYRIACQVNTRIAFNYEKAGNNYLAYKYLNTASKLCKEHKLDDLYSAILIRYALLHRFLSDGVMTPDQEERLVNLDFKGSLDSAIHYTEKAIKYAQKYNNEYDLNEAYITMGILYNKKRKNRIADARAYFLKTIPYWRKTENYEYVHTVCLNISQNFLDEDKAKMALAYNDSAYAHYGKVSVYYKEYAPKIRAKIFYTLGKIDSAYHYQQLGHNAEIERMDLQELTFTKQTEEQYQNDKKEAALKSKNQQVILIGSLLSLIVVTSVLLFRQNRKIKSRNKIIDKQLIELTQTLNQKQVLLSELQHRVKNNLQHVISILEIQKESVSFNNIDELIRSNQNRIHSMALLHKKLNIGDNVNEVDLKRYITELAELVKESYDDRKKKISLDIQCNIDTISIEKALPLGLIITELVSNSMKHAFKKRSVGIITIEITKNKTENQLYYSDNGTGFDFNTTSDKGLGHEIIKGLIDQLDGKTSTKNNNGFELTISFK